MAEVRMAQTNRALQIQYGGLHVLLGIELGDEQLLQSLVGDKFIHRSGGASRDSTDLLMQATEPSVIAAVAPYLSRDEPTKGILLEDYEITRLSVAATMIVLSVAKSSDRLPPEVQQWAREVYYAPFNRNSSREAVRAFWAENAAHFAAKNYQAVRPPRSASPVPAGAGTVPSTNAPAAVVPAAARPPAKRATAITATNPVASPSKPAVPAPAVAVAANPTAPLLWPWLLLAVTSLGGWLWWRTRSA